MKRSTVDAAVGPPRAAPPLGSSSGQLGRRVQEAAEQGREVGEVAFPTLVERIGGVPLDPVALDDVVGVEVGAVVRTSRPCGA